MEVKEKAKELLYKYKVATLDTLGKSSVDAAKTLAIIAVDEMIKHGTPNVWVGTEEQRFYWHNVKKEIETL